MRRKVSLAEVKKFYGDNCFETDSFFGIKQYGKYKPNISFMIEKFQYLERDGSIMNPLAYIEDKEITDNMNLDWGGDAEIMFGEGGQFKKDNAYFYPKSPITSKHLLIKVSWGGCNDTRRGCSAEYAKQVGALYFHKAASNGGGTGNDFWILPIGFVHIIHDDEVDHKTKQTEMEISEERAEYYRQKHECKKNKHISDVDNYLHQCEREYEISRFLRPQFLKRIEIMNRILNNLRSINVYSEYIGTIIAGPTTFDYGYSSYLYSEESVRDLELHIQKLYKRITEAAAKKAKREEYVVKFLIHKTEFEALGWFMLIFEYDNLVRLDNLKHTDHFFRLNEEGYQDYLNFLEEEKTRQIQ